MPSKNVFESLTPNSVANGSLDIKRLKRRAKTLQKKSGCTLSEAQDAIATKNGFSNWSRLMLVQRKHSVIQSAEPKKDPIGSNAPALSAKEFFSDCLDDISLVRKFIDAGGDINEVDEDDETELIRQSRSGHPAMVAELLLCGANANYLNKNYKSALQEAAEHGKTRSCKILIDHGVDVNEPTPLGSTPLGNAALSGFYKTCEMLLDNDAKMTYVLQKPPRGPCRNNVLCTAAMRGRVSLFQLFIDRGVDINLTDMVDGVGDWSPLMWAVYHGNVVGVRALIDLGADVNIVCERTGETALMQAAQDGKSEIFELLLNSGACTDLRDIKGESAFDKAGAEMSFRSLNFVIPWRKNSLIDDGRIHIRRAFDSFGKFR